jgi:hypothetical protein
MATPPLNSYGFLAPGIWPMSFDEVNNLFGRFQGTDRRHSLMARLRAFIDEVRAVDPRIEIVVDGSFVMACIDQPDDIDIALILPADWDVAAELRPFEYNVVSRRMVRKRHGFDLLVGLAGQESAAKALDFFAQVNVKWLDRLGLPPGTVKGLVRIEP